MKRCCICVFWEKNGVVRDYITSYIKGLQEISQKVLVVVNGEISFDSRKKLNELGVDILQRKNKGFNFGAWKDSIKYLGYHELSQYDEVILTNTSCYGPIYPLSEMFEEMESRDCDFWGITKYHELNSNNTLLGGKSKCIQYIQSYFLVFNKNVVLSKCFNSWWSHVKYQKDYRNVLRLYETRLTNYFEKNRFKSDTYIDLNITKAYVDNPLLITDKLLTMTRMPLIKRNALVSEYENFVSDTLTYQTNNILEFIKTKTNYNIDLIYEDIISSYPMSEIKQSLHLNYILSPKITFSKENTLKTALIMYIYYEDLVEYCFKYAKSMPEGSDIYIVSSKLSTIKTSKEKSSMLAGYNLIYRLKENRGRDVSAYLVTCADVFKNYDLICCMHDKKTPQSKGIISNDFSYQCYECNLASKEYVNNIISLFRNNKYLGMLTNPILHFWKYRTDVAGNELSINTPQVENLYKKLKLNIPFDKHPIAPFGSMFWIRSEAIKPLFRHCWAYEDFPDEPLPPDGTVSHAIERIYPSVVQEAGFLSGWVMPDNFANIYIDNLFSIHNLKRINNVKPFRLKNSPIENIFSIKNTLDRRHKAITLFGVKIKFKRKIYN